MLHQLVHVLVLDRGQGADDGRIGVHDDEVAIAMGEKLAQDLEPSLVGDGLVAGERLGVAEGDDAGRHR